MQVSFLGKPTLLLFPTLYASEFPETWEFHNGLHCRHAKCEALQHGTNRRTAQNSSAHAGTLVEARHTKFYRAGGRPLKSEKFLISWFFFCFILPGLLNFISRRRLVLFINVP
jgi:hypothetical protein